MYSPFGAFCFFFFFFFKEGSKIVKIFGKITKEDDGQLNFKKKRERSIAVKELH